MDGRRELGARGEELAARFLESQRYTILARNFRCRAGEIDLVALDDQKVVFVEVRARSGERLGTPLESVDVRKQARVVRVARHFVAARGYADHDARFDVIGVRFDREPPTVEHVRDAFQVDG